MGMPVNTIGLLGTKYGTEWLNNDRGDYLELAQLRDQMCPR